MAKAASSKRAPLRKPVSAFLKPSSPHSTAIPPARAHSLTYHYPLLLDDGAASGALLKWFEGIEEKREMPWRKRWIAPAEFEGSETELGAVLSRRAYEVWVSEIMLQQTRVSTVIPYFNTWISKWSTVEELAKANHDDVLAAWKGLGYYSRATRLYEGAKAMMSQNSSLSCPIPNTAEELQKFPGIGRYTAGAISSIAFGLPEPVLDGNVVRVLSRQMGVYADGKEKKINDAFWDVADQLVKDVAGFPEVEKSRVPGMWNQAMMELGSTVCTPRPKCQECPIQRTCRTYAEGVELAEKKGRDEEVRDIEDACGLCGVLDTEELATAPEDDEDEEGEISVKPKKKRKVEPKKPPNTISHYFAVKTPIATPRPDLEDKESTDAAIESKVKKRKAPSDTAKLKSITAYCSLFPKKIPKKKVAEEHAVVCVIEVRHPEEKSKWLIEQRPAKGLLASLWQFPQSTLSTLNTTSAFRKSAAKDFVRNLDVGLDLSEATFIADHGSLVHVFSHLKLTMHIQHFQLDAGDEEERMVLESSKAPTRNCKWVATEDMDGETLSTGMRRCWNLINKNLKWN